MIRHSLGHHLRVDKGFDLEQIKEVLRHSDISTTSIYTKATGEEVKEKMRTEVFEE
jgi:site-specific recombinase XerD